MQNNRSKALSQRTINDWKRILNMPEGRRIAWQLLNACNFRHHSFVPGDPYATAFHCGQQSIGCYLEEKIREANFSALEQMEQEFLAEQKQFKKQDEETEEYI